jgi:cytochrome c5
MGTYQCERCSKTEVVDMIPRRGKICFGCHVKTIHVGFAAGREDFHGPTIKERQDKTVSDAKINGYNAEPVGQRWV